jgi:hypothetical protein
MVSTVRSVRRATNLDNIYESPLLDWSGVEARLNKGVTQAPGTGSPDRHTCWLATINRNGSPRSLASAGFALMARFGSRMGETTRNGRNLARDQRCTLSVATAEFDLVVEGRASRSPTRPGSLSWQDGLLKDGLPALTTPVKPLPPTTAHHRLGRHRGTSIASNLTLRQLSGQRSRSGPHGGTSDRR